MTSFPMRVCDLLLTLYLYLWQAGTWLCAFLKSGPPGSPGTVGMYGKPYTPYTPYKFANGTLGVSYVVNRQPYIALRADQIRSRPSSPITNVLIKDAANASLTDARLVTIFKSLGGHAGDFHQQAYTLDQIQALFGELPSRLSRVICTNENYDEFVFKNKEV